MADLAQLMEIAPTVGAGFIGQNQAMQQREQEAKLMELAQLIQSRQGQEQRAQAQHPFELEKLRLGNESTGAQIPGLVATSRKLGVDANIAEATQGTSIDSTNSKNKMAAYREVGQHLGSLSRAISDNPTVPPHAAFAQALDQIGLSPERKQKLMQRYTNVPAAKLQERLSQDGASILRENDKYAQAFDTTELQTSANLVNSEYERQSRERIAELDRGAGKFDKRGGTGKEFDEGSTWAKRVADSRSAKERHSAALGAAEFWKAQGNEGKAGYYMGIADAAEPQAKAEIAAAAGPRAGDVAVEELTGGSVPTNRPTPIRQPASGKPAPAGGDRTGPADIAAMVKAQGGTYDPSKFDYRINPQTGKVQARPK
jgi:hypothetical protein